MMRTRMDGFSPEGDKPSAANVMAFAKYLSESVLTDLQGEPSDWDEILDSAYSKLAFFRVYYCGECPSQMPLIRSIDP